MAFNPNQKRNNVPGAPLSGAWAAEPKNDAVGVDLAAAAGAPETIATQKTALARLAADGILAVAQEHLPNEPVERIARVTLEDTTEDEGAPWLRVTSFQDAAGTDLWSARGPNGDEDPDDDDPMAQEFNDFANELKSDPLRLVPLTSGYMEEATWAWTFDKAPVGQQ